VPSQASFGLSGDVQISAILSSRPEQIIAKPWPVEWRDLALQPVPGGLGVTGNSQWDAAISREFSEARCPRFAPVHWALTWAHVLRSVCQVRHFSCALCNGLNSTLQLEPFLPNFFITRFSYARHRQPPESLRRYLDSALSGAAPVSRDKRFSGRKFFTCSLTTNGPDQYLASARQIGENRANCHLLNTLPAITLLSST